MNLRQLQLAMSIISGRRVPQSDDRMEYKLLGLDPNVIYSHTVLKQRAEEIVLNALLMTGPRYASDIPPDELETAKLRIEEAVKALHAIERSTAMGGDLGWVTHRFVDREAVLKIIREIL